MPQSRSPHLNRNEGFSSKALNLNKWLARQTLQARIAFRLLLPDAASAWMSPVGCKCFPMLLSWCLIKPAPNKNHY
jgi:hypothetical protein